MKLKEFLQNIVKDTEYSVSVYENDVPDWVTDVTSDDILSEIKQAKLTITRLKESNRQRLLGLIEKKLISDNIKYHKELVISEHS
jgi:hypothetical protein